MFKKFMLSFDFSIDDEFTSLISAHRTLVNHLIKDKVIDYYAVSMETKKGWIVFNTDSKDQIESFMSQSPLFDYLKNFDISELFVLDGPHLRIPSKLELN